MKIERGTVPSFEPVIITIETREELSEIYKYLANSPSSTPPSIYSLLKRLDYMLRTSV